MYYITRVERDKDRNPRYIWVKDSKDGVEEKLSMQTYSDYRLSGAKIIGNAAKDARIRPVPKNIDPKIKLLTGMDVELSSDGKEVQYLYATKGKSIDLSLLPYLGDCCVYGNGGTLVAKGKYALNPFAFVNYIGYDGTIINKEFAHLSWYSERTKAFNERYSVNLDISDLADKNADLLYDYSSIFLDSSNAAPLKVRDNRYRYIFRKELATHIEDEKYLPQAIERYIENIEYITEMKYWSHIDYLNKYFNRYIADKCLIPNSEMDTYSEEMWIALNDFVAIAGKKHSRTMLVTLISDFYHMIDIVKTGNRDESVLSTGTGSCDRVESAFSQLTREYTYGEPDTPPYVFFLSDKAAFVLKLFKYYLYSRGSASKAMLDLARALAIAIDRRKHITI